MVEGPKLSAGSNLGFTAGPGPDFNPLSFIFPLLAWLRPDRGATHLLPPPVRLHKDDCLQVTRPCPASPPPSPRCLAPPLPRFHSSPSPSFPRSTLSKHQRDLSYPNGLNLLTGNNSRSTSRPRTSHSHVTMCSCNDRQGRGSGRAQVLSAAAAAAAAACSLRRTVRGARAL